jgi:hypothetical protein
MDRIVVLDALRGACFVFMTMDHFPGNPFFRFSNANYGPFGFFNAALGFVFLSGLVGGLVYERHRVAHGSRSMSRRILCRVRDLYVTQMVIFLALAVTVALHLSGVSRWNLDAISDTPWKGLFFGSFLLYEPGYLGILPMYCAFLLLTPLLLWQFRSGHLRYVLGLSIALWLCSGLMIELPENPQGVNFGAFNPFSYQVLFVVGLAFGTGYLRIECLSPATRKWLVRSCVALAAVCFFLRQQYAADGPFNPLLNHLSEAFSSYELGPLRMLSFGAFAVILYALSRDIDWANVESPAFRWLAFVGRHSLPVFAWSILATYAAIALLPLHPDAVLRSLGVVVAVASLTIPAYVHAMIRRREVPLPARSIIGALHATSARRAA